MSGWCSNKRGLNERTMSEDDPLLSDDELCNNHNDHHDNHNNNHAATRLRDVNGMSVTCLRRAVRKFEGRFDAVDEGVEFKLPNSLNGKVKYCADPTHEFVSVHWIVSCKYGVESRRGIESDNEFFEEVPPMLVNVNEFERYVHKCMRELSGAVRDCRSNTMYYVVTRRY